jgi:hypothetical protein
LVAASVAEHEARESGINSMALLQTISVGVGFDESSVWLYDIEIRGADMHKTTRLVVSYGKMKDFKIK